MARIEVCVDTVDREAIIGWWLAALDYVRVPEGGRDLLDPTGDGPAVWFQEVPETKSTKNRLHLDVYVSKEEALRRRDTLVGMGGRWVDQGPDFWVLTDPEGNELCLCWD